MPRAARASMPVPRRFRMFPPLVKFSSPPAPPHPRWPKSPPIRACIVTFQSGSACAAVAGTARLSDDRARLAELWSETWRIWYPAGLDDATLCLIAVTPSAAEYWDNSGIKSLKYLFKSAKAYLLGERMDTDEAHAHAKLDLS